MERTLIMHQDLVVLSNHGHDLKGKVSRSEVFGGTGVQSIHTKGDAFFFCENGTRCRSVFDGKNIIPDFSQTQGKL